MSYLFYEHGNKCGRLLGRALRLRTTAAGVPYLRSNNGEKIYKPTLIACMFKEYYKPLYSLYASDFEMVPLDASLVGITVQPKPGNDASLCQNYR